MTEDSASFTADGYAGSYGARRLLAGMLRHRRELIAAHAIAVLAVLASVPLPLPLLVDEVLLHVPGTLVQSMGRLFPAAWRGPTFADRHGERSEGD